MSYALVVVISLRKFLLIFLSERGVEFGVFVFGGILVFEVVFVSSLGNSLGELSESSFDSLSDGTEEFEFLLSGGGGGLILVLSSGTEVLGVVVKSGVSVSLGGGGVDDTGLGSDTLLEFTDFLGKVLLLLGKVGDGGLESGLISGVLSN